MSVVGIVLVVILLLVLLGGLGRRDAGPLLGLRLRG